MTVDINHLLALPQKERRKIAEKLWDSLSPNQAVSKEDKEVIRLLNKRWENIRSGKSKLYSSSEIKNKIAEYRTRKFSENL